MLSSSDLIVAAPWIIFGVALATMAFRLVRSSRRR
jgi:hypothetical protein